ncbi:hypothetical protein O6H91_03G111300 [Diphasiastrum complanatum]|uniref:Uncharacterized protein n=2 Tax=Diphasiastrum complanatum TaxID=34168 RepID=A0ACC2EAD9_DIPCM|nr:hypothetical protein O6H91_03G111100 [Diphasiastrum complanatum]KAJ7563465.1 hypothetical protein O6H91_03G111300 [Diphasiastrum complanatum]
MVTVTFSSAFTLSMVHYLRCPRMREHITSVSLLS